MATISCVECQELIKKLIRGCSHMTSLLFSSFLTPPPPCHPFYYIGLCTSVTFWRPPSPLPRPWRHMWMPPKVESQFPKIFFKSFLFTEADNLWTEFLFRHFCQWICPHSCSQDHCQIIVKNSLLVWVEEKWIYICWPA